MKKLHMLSLLLCSALLAGQTAGCAKTPEKPIVREKTALNADGYKEAEPLPEKSKSNALSERLQVPEKYEASGKSSDGSFEFSCAADVDVPDVTAIPIYKVSQKPFDEEWIARVTKTFFGDAPIYNGEQYFQTTKAEALETLNELKAYQAEGNLDPYGFIAQAREFGEENPEEAYNLQEHISSWEDVYNNAPETIEKTEVTPALHEDLVDPTAFSGAVEMDGDVYDYRMKAYASLPMNIRVRRISGEYGFPHWESLYYSYTDGNGSPANSRIPPREKAEELAGITPEQAVETADQYMEKLGLTNFSAKNTSLALCEAMDSFPSAYSQPTFYNAAYMVSYTRDVDGFPVTDEWDLGGSLESMESTQETWCYERVEFYINKNGLQQAEIRNLYQIEEEQVSNVELLSFPEIADDFEQMVQIRYADYTSPERHITLDINNVKLGYMRIYDPGADAESGLLVPVWDFFGTWEDRFIHDDGTEEISRDSSPDRSYLTINAADGTVINRSYGY